MLNYVVTVEVQRSNEQESDVEERNLLGEEPEYKDGNPLMVICTCQVLVIYPP